VGLGAFSPRIIVGGSGIKVGGSGGILDPPESFRIFPPLARSAFRACSETDFWINSVTLYCRLRPVSNRRRRASHVPNALETIDNEAFHLIIYCL
jgi:hypothetical protein